MKVKSTIASQTCPKSKYRNPLESQCSITDFLRQAELSVQDFLAADDPRTMAEGWYQPPPFRLFFINQEIDLTDKFDFAFLCGDLNFRLDISRLHADWLISRQGLNSILPCNLARKP
jgi:hypothetical protein